MRKIQSARRIRNSAFSIIEATIALFVIVLITGVTMVLVIVSTRTSAHQQASTGLNNDARLTIDEMLTQARCSDLVLSSKTVGSKQYSTGDSTLVLQAPGYNPSTKSVFLTGSEDAIIYNYDKTSSTLTETVVPVSGSVRPTRSSLILARNVSEVSFTYRVREQFKAPSTGTQSLSLTAVPLETPVVFINGTAGTLTWTSGSQKVTVSATMGDDVQVCYKVSPTASGGAALSYITEIEASVRFSTTDAANTIQTDSIQGSARLRNLRI